VTFINTPLPLESSFLPTPTPTTLSALALAPHAVRPSVYRCQCYLTLCRNWTTNAQPSPDGAHPSRRQSHLPHAQQSYPAYEPSMALSTDQLPTHSYRNQVSSPCSAAVRDDSLCRSDSTVRPTKTSLIRAFLLAPLRAPGTIRALAKFLLQWIIEDTLPIINTRQNGSSHPNLHSTTTHNTGTTRLASCTCHLFLITR